MKKEQKFQFWCAKSIVIFILGFLSLSDIQAENRVVDLHVGYKTVNFTGCPTKAVAVNDQIPAPTLHFKEGDYVTLNVYNHLDKGTSIHWHGILIPWQMDGVEGVNQKAIPPGCVFQYRFKLYQRGTYWYHAHAEAQEQDGLYGAFVIDPPATPHYQYTKDYVVVLSDWSDMGGHNIFLKLKKDGDYFSPRFPLQPSLTKFLHDYGKACPKERKKLLADYKMMQQMRMSIYDISDVAYDSYLLNGETKNCPWTAPVRVGDMVRLRFIGAAGSTIYRVKMHCANMQMVHVQGNDVKPYTINNFTIAPGETYDVLVKIQKHMPYIIYAESIDTLGKAYGALVTDPLQPILYNQVVPFPEPLPVTREMMMNMMMSMDHGSMGNGSMKHGAMDIKNHSWIKMAGEQQTMPSHTDQDMKSMMHNNSKEASHSKHSMQSSASNKMKHSMDMSQMDHSKMNMPKSDKASHEGMKHTSANGTTGKMTSHAQHGMSGGMKKNKGKMDHDMSMQDDMEDMQMPTEPSIIGDRICPTNSSKAMTMGTKYQDLTAAVATNDPNKPVYGIIKMELFGYMDRFIWFINGLPEYRAKPICILPGKRYRIIFSNNSMMRHPMHIHGHWFILRNDHGAHDPLLHTIEVPPGATAVADIDADASGQWFFHCHHLFHMMAGMARVFQYGTIIEVAHGTIPPENYASFEKYINRPIVREDITMPLDRSLIHHPVGHHQGFYMASLLDVGEDPYHNVQEVTFKGLYGGDYNKLELYTDDAELKEGKVENADIDIFYWHLISQFWAVKGGVNYFYRPGGPYWQPGIGIEGLMPYFIDTNVRIYCHEGSIKFDIELQRDTQITNNFFIRTGIRGISATKTVAEDELGSGLNQMRYTIRPYYRLMPGLNIFVEYEHDDDYGAFKSIQRKQGESTTEDTLTFGLSVLF
ncbi:MAG: multicopper oxidase domain-containing protein [Gammaproteobacteria bacterium]|nr:multicopper oxidase domain-containing protein [Gammaproteobacteria bacterium]